MSFKNLFNKQGSKRGRSMTGGNGLLNFSDINYTVDYKTRKGEKTKKDILIDVSGEIRRGELVAIMGPSGSGKSTFLDVLAGRLDPRKFKGSMTIDGAPVDRKEFKRRAAYVQQDEALYPMLTVRETLMYSAMLRLPHTMSRKEKKARVNAVIEELGLGKVVDTKVGNHDVRGISGGERRRLSIGVELIIQPQYLFLDEPTSGLDSTSTKSVIQVLRHLAHKGNRTVIISIHQPNSNVFHMLDKVMFLAEGNMVYFGPTDGRLLHRFDELGFPIPPATNPPDHVMDVILDKDQGEKLKSITRKVRETNGTGTGTLPQMATLETPSEAPVTERLLINDEPSEMKESTSRSQIMDVIERNSKYATPFWVQLLVLMHREFLNTIRTKELFLIRCCIYVFSSLVLGSLFFQVEENVTGANEIFGLLVFALANGYFTSLEAISVFLAQREIFKREYSNNWYSVEAFVLSGFFVSVPFLAFLALIFSTPAYWMVGLAPTAGQFLFFVLVMFVVLMVARNFSIFVSSFAVNHSMGNALGSSLYAFMFLFAGFFIIRSQIPDYWIWLHYISVFKWPLEAFAVNQFLEDDEFDCTGASTIVAPPSNCTLTGEDILSGFDMEDDNKWFSLGILALFAAVFLFGFYAVLTFKFRPKN